MYKEHAAYDRTSLQPSIRDLLMKIRFLTFTPQEFAEGPAKSSLLTEAEKFAILMKILCLSTDVQMPAGFCLNTQPRQKPGYIPSLDFVNMIN